MTTYINIYGGPGTGKSTIAAEIFYLMKIKGFSVELVTEYAKDLVWENRKDTLAIQPYISMKQFRNLIRLRDKVDFVVTDSPLLKDIVYAKKYAPELPSSYYRLLSELHKSLGKSINLLLERVVKYETTGRNQTEVEATQLDTAIRDMLKEYEQEFIVTRPKAAKHLITALGIEILD